MLTDRRYLFLHEGRNRSSQTSVALDLVPAVHVRHGLLAARIRTQESRSLAEFKQVDKVDAELFARCAAWSTGGRGCRSRRRRRAAPARGQAGT